MKVVIYFNWPRDPKVIKDVVWTRVEDQTFFTVCLKSGTHRKYPIRHIFCVDEVAE